MPGGRGLLRTQTQTQTLTLALALALTLTLTLALALALTLTRSADRTFELKPTAFGYTAPPAFCEWAKREPGGGSHLEAVYSSRSKVKG